MEDNFYEQERRLEQQSLEQRGLTRQSVRSEAVDGMLLEGESLGRYTAKTFGLMFVALMVSFGVAAFIAWTWPGLYLVADIYNVTGGFLPILLLVLQLGLSAGMRSAIENVSVGKAWVFFLIHSVVIGFCVGTWLLLYELESVALVFAATALYFGGMAVFGFVTNIDLSRIRNLLFGGVIFLIVMNLAMWFIPGIRVTEQVVCTIGVVVFLAYTAYDTQMIKRFYAVFKDDEGRLRAASLYAALALCLDFVNMFIYLLRILGRSRKN